MDEMQDNRSVLVPAGILLGLVSLLIVVAFILRNGIEPPAYLNTSTPAPTLPQAQSLLETVQFTSTATITITPRPTWTVLPSRTPTITPTPTPTSTATRVRIPTLTAALPNRINELYALSTLTAEHMDRIARTINDYPDAQFRPQARDTDAYNAYFIYPAIVFQEALLRFPQAETTHQWRWGLAYSLARLGDPQATTLFRDLLLDALNTGGISLEELPDFVRENAPDLTLIFHPLELSPGQPEMKLLEILEGRMAILLWEDQAGSFHLNPLNHNFDFKPGRNMSYATLDIDADGLKEVAIYQAETQGDTTIASPLVFHPDPFSMAQVDVQITLPKDYKLAHSTTLTSIGNSNGGDSLQVSSSFFSSCPFEVIRLYQWDGSQMELVSQRYQLHPQSELLTYCEPVLTQAQDIWEVPAWLEILKVLEPLWPPAADPQGRPYPISDRDKLRFQLAVYLSLNGESSEAVTKLDEIAASPADSEGEWIEKAAAFKRTLTQEGLYLACQSTPECDLHAAIRQTLAANPVQEPSQAKAELQSAGVAIRSSGVFDFDQDGSEDGWLTLQPHPLDKLEFWILARSPRGVQPLFMVLTDFTETRPYWSDAQVYPGVFQITTRQGFMLNRLPDSLDPYLTPVAVEPILTTYTLDALQESELGLLNGQNPSGVRDHMLEVLNSGRYNCKSDRICDRFTYILGLAYELAGDSIQARDTYIRLWWENRQSPLAAVARLKLVYLPSLRTPTPTRTRSPSPTPTSSVTPSPTATP